MAFEVKMPKLGMMEGDIQLVEWKKKEGDSIDKGEAIATIEGQKVSNDVEAAVGGTVLKLLIEEGDEASIGTVIAIIGNAGEDISGLVGATAAPAAAKEEDAAPAASVAVSAPAATGDDDVVKASPAAKKLAKANGINLADVAAALGTSKRLQGEDVQRYIDEGMSAPKSAVPVATCGFTETKLVGMRKTIAENMGKSSRETAPVVLMRSVDITELHKIRKAKKAEYEARGKKAPSFNDIIIKAVALALEKHPRLNATFQDNVVRTYNDININMAIAIDAGLVTPVIPNTNKLSADEISAKAKELARKAAANELTGADYSGGTFTVTNLGMLDIEVSTPILNPPQVAILAVGTVQPFLKLEAGGIVERYKTYFSLTLDHRVVDGYPGAQYLYTLAEILTNDPGKLWY